MLDIGPRWIKRSGMNRHPALCPLFERQPQTRDMEGTTLELTAFLCCWFPKLGGKKKKQGVGVSAPQAQLPLTCS